MLWSICGTVFASIFTTHLYLWFEPLIKHIDVILIIVSLELVFSLRSFEHAAKRTIPALVLLVSFLLFLILFRNCFKTLNQHKNVDTFCEVVAVKRLVVYFYPALFTKSSLFFIDEKLLMHKTWLTTL